ncbi:hypothetical protein AK812_SmicGene13386 [Symbiodinium microadriaticum]|uniref:Uncharacterized protein n=1 Tax=Symbiodinium microadriaticum TaxID=2951 RepID=A0A1Q9E8C1_SYMMI|nr:hypothetical protein AK812_SmicGene13386 [Symbiodinium microadriaticum]
MVEDQRASQPATLQESQRSSNYCARDANKTTLPWKCETFVISASRKATDTAVASTFRLQFKLRLVSHRICVGDRLARQPGSSV